jgi:leucyl aminopeptidase
MSNYMNLSLVERESPAQFLQISFQPAATQVNPGKPGKTVGETFFQPTGDHNSLIVSLGEATKWKPETFRQAGGAAAKWMLQNKIDAAEIDETNLSSFQLPNAISALFEGLILGAFRFDEYKAEKKFASPLSVFIRTDDPGSLQTSIDHAQIICDSVNLGRYMGHEPANVINPITLAERISALAAEVGIKCTVIDEKALEDMGAGGLINVGKGSATPSRLIILEYSGQPGARDTHPLVLIGKAITFDTGGYSLKGVDNIVNMKYDKCGGITVAATLLAAARLGLPQSLIGIIAASENMVSAQAYRPDDIIKMLSGKTVEIISTDAEGRLVLADALTYAQQSFSPRAIIDLATLTGGVLVALGRVRAAVMGNDDRLAHELIASGEATSELLWQLPMDDDYGKLIKSDEADIKNSGGREGHAILGGMFLKEFVKDDIPWAHLDIAGMADSNKDLPYCPKGATGFGVRLLIHYIEHLE